MYVSRHVIKFIKTGQKASSRRLPIIDFQNEIVEMYVAREGVEEGEEKEVGEGGGSSNGLLEGGWDKITHPLSWQSLDNI